MWFANPTKATKRLGPDGSITYEGNAHQSSEHDFQASTRCSGNYASMIFLYQFSCRCMFFRDLNTKRYQIVPKLFPYIPAMKGESCWNNFRDFFFQKRCNPRHKRAGVCYILIYDWTMIRWCGTSGHLTSRAVESLTSGKKGKKENGSYLA